MPPPTGKGESVEREILRQVGELREEFTTLNGDVREHLGRCDSCYETIARLVKAVDGNDGTGLKQRMSTVESKQQDHSDTLKTFSANRQQTRTAVITAGAAIVCAALALIGTLIGVFAK